MRISHPADARVIDGNAISATIRQSYKPRIERLNALGVTPGLAVVLVGDDPASAIYVKNKLRACEALNIAAFCKQLPSLVSTADLVAVIEDFNRNTAVHGVLVQLPLPQHLDMRRVLESIALEKDVDGFHLYNVGGLVVGDTIFSPCTPYGVVKLLEFERILIEGQNVVIVGASNVVGKPMALMLMQRGATVAICHVKTRDLAEFTMLADILIVAVGRPNLIVPQMVRTGAVVIDVGINRLPNGGITGDVDFEGVREKASYITPVPGGVGPMTVTMLLENTIVSAERAAGSPRYAD